MTSFHLNALCSKPCQSQKARTLSRPFRSTVSIEVLGIPKALNEQNTPQPHSKVSLKSEPVKGCKRSSKQSLCYGTKVPPKKGHDRKFRVNVPNLLMTKDNTLVPTLMLLMLVDTHLVVFRRFQSLGQLSRKKLHPTSETSM